MYKCICMSICTCMYVHIYMYMYICIHIHIYTRPHVHTHTYIYIHVHHLPPGGQRGADRPVEQPDCSHQSRGPHHLSPHCADIHRRSHRSKRRRLHARQSNVVYDTPRICCTQCSPAWHLAVFERFIYFLFVRCLHARYSSSGARGWRVV